MPVSCSHLFLPLSYPCTKVLVPILQHRPQPLTAAARSDADGRDPFGKCLALIIVVGRSDELGAWSEAKSPDGIFRRQRPTTPGAEIKRALLKFLERGEAHRIDRRFGDAEPDGICLALHTGRVHPFDDPRAISTRTLAYRPAFGVGLSEETIK